MGNFVEPKWDEISQTTRELNSKKHDAAWAIIRRLSKESSGKIIDDEARFFDQRSDNYPEGPACYIIPSNFPVDTLERGIMRRIQFKTGTFLSNLSNLSIEELNDYALNVLGITDELEFK